MELLYSGHEYYDSNHLPCKKIKINEINNYLDNNLGLIALFNYLKKLKTLIANLFPWLEKNKK